MWWKALTVVLCVTLALNVAVGVYLFMELRRVSEQLEAVAGRPAGIPGKGLDQYDLTSPLSSVQSMKEMVSTFDVRAGVDFFRLGSNTSSGPFLDYLLDDRAQVSIERTHVIERSSRQGAQGKVLAYVRVISSGVEARDVWTFERRDGAFIPSSFVLLDYNEDDWTEEDRYLRDAERTWKTTGRLP